MIKNIFTKIANTLGEEFVLYYFENAFSLTDEEKDLYENKTIGVFYVSSADYAPLQGSQGLQGAGVLSLLVPITGNDVLQQVQYAFERLVQNTNGQVMSDGTVYDYVLNWQYPVPVGNVDNTYGNKRQPYQMAFTFAISKDNIYGNGVSVTVDGEALTGVTLRNIMSNVNTFPKTNINKFQLEHPQQYSDFALSVDAFVQNTAVWQKIIGDRIMQRESSYVVSLSVPDLGVTRIFNAVLSNCQFVATNDQFQVAQLTFVPEFWGYAVTYLPNGGSGETTDPDSPYEPGTVITVLANNFTRAGYSFVGWDLTPSGSGDILPGMPVTLNAPLTLYAIWEAD